MHSVTKVMPIQFMNSKCHIKKRKSCKTALSSYYACLSHDLLLMPLGVDRHTHIYQRSQEKRVQETRHMKPGACRLACTWFFEIVLFAPGFLKLFCL